MIYIIATLYIQSQVNLTNWRSYTSQMETKSVCLDSNGNYWAATLGGAFKYNIKDSSFEEFRNIDALLTIDLNKVSADKDNIYFGSNDGILEIYNFKKGWKHISDIKNSGFSNARINDIVSYDGKVYIAGGFGLAIFDPVENIFIEDIKRFGDFPPQVEAKKILIKNNTIWLATTNGVATTKLGSSISDKNIWITYSDSSGLFEKNLIDIIDINDVIYTCSENIVFKLDSSKFVSIVNNLVEINSLTQLNNSFLIGSLNNVFDYTNNISKYEFNLTKLINIKNELIYLQKGNSFSIEYPLKPIRHQVKPNSPISNYFVYIEKTKNGSLWASGGPNNGKGIMRLKENKWENLTLEKYPSIRTNAFVKLSSINNDIFAGSFGAGQVIINENSEGFNFDTLTNNNSPFLGVSGSPHFIIVGNSKLDKYGNVWSVNWASDRANILIKQSKDGLLTGYKNCTNQNNTIYFTLDIDNNDTKWVTSSTANVTASGELTTTGLYYFNDNGTPDNLNDDYCGTLTTNYYPTLRSMSQTDIKIDKTGYLWVGTPNGVSVIVNPSAAITSKSPSFIVREIKPLKELNVRQIMIDALNNKWIATTKGIYVMNPDGTEVIAIFNSSNTPIPVNDVYSMANDPQTGEVYFGTSKGLYVANSLSIQPVDSYGIDCYPQPFKRLTDEYLTIDGLAISTEIKITTLDGELIKSLKTESKKMIWDGKNEKGELAKSGIYMIIANSGTTESKEVAKFMIVDK